MPDHASQSQNSSQGAIALAACLEAALKAETTEDLAKAVLPFLVRVEGIKAAFIYLEEPNLGIHDLFQTGIPAKTLPRLKEICAARFRQTPATEIPPPAVLPLPPRKASRLVLFPIGNRKNLGFAGAVAPEPESILRKTGVARLMGALSHLLDRLLDRLADQKRITRLQAYLAVSSKIAQTLNLRKVIEAVLYSCMEAVAAEAASVLLLDSGKKNFRFYGVEGPAKPLLLDVTFPSHQGLAGYVLRTKEAAIFNDVQHDSRFYRKFDSESGFKTLSMVAIPLMAREEEIGVLEVLNKAGGEPFSEDDRLLLQSIAEEIAFAIRNANLYEEKQRLAAEIHRMHQFQTRLIQTSNDGIIANDSRGNVIIFNEGAERILGYRSEEVIGRINVADLYPPGMAREVKAMINSPQFGGAGRLIHYETLARSQTGEPVPVEMSASLIQEEDDEVVTVGFFRDLRERKQLQAKLMQSERLAALGSMAAHISHEVKNPLMVIGGIARQVLRGSGGDEKRNLEKLQVIAEEIRRLEDFLAEVGSFAKLSQTQESLVDVNGLIRKMCRQLEASLQEGGITLKLDLDSLLPRVLFDPGHLRQVLLNLAKNGIEAMGAGGVLTMSSGRKGEGIFVQVADTGAGIPADILPRIFQPFFSTKQRGSGLGLAIAQGIMEANHGEIKIESEPAKGTQVTLWLKGKS